MIEFIIVFLYYQFNNILKYHINSAFGVLIHGQLHLYFTFKLQHWVTFLLLLLFRLATGTMVFELHSVSTFTLNVLETLYITKFLELASLTVKRFEAYFWIEGFSVVDLMISAYIISNILSSNL